MSHSVAPQAKPSFLRSVKAVAWSFVGIRKGSESRQDMARVSPVHVIVAGFAAAAVFVGALVALVHWVVK